ncbi:hypothetical protein B0J14DRAFT_661055 [Halenospora varia]|nr:hypothetical protein B0J14DRAFT_661055 [Halenospora varia]
MAASLSTTFPLLPLSTSITFESDSLEGKGREIGKEEEERTIYGGTITTTFVSTITYIPGQKSVPINFPYPLIIAPPQFTTLPGPGGRIEPVLVLTAVVGIVDLDGRPIATGTLVEKAPPETFWEIDDRGGLRCSSWKCWTEGQQAAVVIAALIVGSAVFGLLVWGLCCFRRRKTRRVVEDIEEVEVADLEGGRMGERGRLATLFLGARERSTSHEVEVEMERRRRRRRRRRRSRSASSLSNLSSSNDEGLRRSRGPSARAVSRGPGSVRDEGMRFRRPPRSPYPERPPTSHQSKVRDYVVPAAALAGAGVVAATMAARSRSRSTPPNTQTVAARKHRRPRGPPPTSMRDLDDHTTNDGTEAEAGIRVMIESFGATGGKGNYISPAPGPLPNKTKNKNKKRNQQAKWLLLLPLILRAVNVLTKPDGGWDQYFDIDKKKKKQKDGPGRCVFQKMDLDA